MKRNQIDLNSKYRQITNLKKTTREQPKGKVPSLSSHRTSPSRSRRAPHSTWEAQWPLRCDRRQESRAQCVRDLGRGRVCARSADRVCTRSKYFRLLLRRLKSLGQYLFSLMEGAGVREKAIDSRDVYRVV